MRSHACIHTPSQRPWFMNHTIEPEMGEERRTRATRSPPTLIRGRPAPLRQLPSLYDVGCHVPCKLYSQVWFLTLIHDVCTPCVWDHSSCPPYFAAARQRYPSRLALLPVAACPAHPPSAANSDAMHIRLAQSLSISLRSAGRKCVMGWRYARGTGGYSAAHQTGWTWALPTTSILRCWFC